MGQKAFYFDMKKCAGCHACEIACRDRNALYNVGELFRKVDLYEGGKFPKPWMYILSIACNHCAKPACSENGTASPPWNTGRCRTRRRVCLKAARRPGNEQDQFFSS